MTTSSQPDDATSEGADGPAAEAETPRVIGGLGAYAIVAGSMLGVGIFLFPGKVAFEVDSLGAFIAIWLVGGLFALSGSVACGELGAMMPRAGGDYVFQREAFGPSLAFASGWVLFAAIFSGSIASLSVALFQYEVGPLLGANLTAPIGGEGGFISGAQLGAIGLIVFLTVVNDLGAKVSGWVQTALTLTPIAAMAGLGIYVLVAQPEATAPLELTSVGATELTLGGLAAAFLFVNFAFSGWLNIIYVAGEVKNPGRTIPRSMVTATLSVTALYLLLCVAFVAVLGLSGLAQSGANWMDGGTALATVLESPGLRTFALVLIAVALVTSLNATVLASARVGYAMGKGGAFLPFFGKLSGKRQVPQRALWLQAFISSVIVLSGTFDDVVKMTSLAMLVTGSFTILSLFVLRVRKPEAKRPYRATGYPVLPALYVLLSLLAIAAEVWKASTTTEPNPWYPLIGVGVLGVAFVAHLAYSANKQAAGVAAGLILSFLAVREASAWFG